MTKENRKRKENFLVRVVDDVHRNNSISQNFQQFNVTNFRLSLTTEVSDIELFLYEHIKNSDQKFNFLFLFSFVIYQHSPLYAYDATCGGGGSSQA
jgi:hypothetical protein